MAMLPSSIVRTAKTANFYWPGKLLLPNGFHSDGEISACGDSMQDSTVTHGPVIKVRFYDQGWRRPINRRRQVEFFMSLQGVTTNCHNA